VQCQRRLLSAVRHERSHVISCIGDRLQDGRQVAIGVPQRGRARPPLYRTERP